MSILVCPLSKVTELVASRRPGRVISLLDPGSTFPELGDRYSDRHLRLTFHDVHVSAGYETAPSRDDVLRIVEFLKSWDRRESVLIHCRAGISRSTAAGFIAACLSQPAVPELHLAKTLRRVAPTARPNQVMVQWGDDILDRQGRMSRAILDTSADLPWLALDEGEPFELPIA
jgi:predicted protein tyrosine phosphatase